MTEAFAGSRDDRPAVASALPCLDDFMPSIEEAHALTGPDDMRDTRLFFLDRGLRCCVFTLGADGASSHHADGTHFTVPAYAIDVRCTCGCGDAFDAGFAVARRRGMDPETAVRFAQAASTLNTTGLRSQAGIVSFEQNWEFMTRTPLRPSNLHAVPP